MKGNHDKNILEQFSPSSFPYSGAVYSKDTVICLGIDENYIINSIWVHLQIPGAGKKRTKWNQLAAIANNCNKSQYEKWEKNAKCVKQENIVTAILCKIFRAFFMFWDSVPSPQVRWK